MLQAPSKGRQLGLASSTASGRQHALTQQAQATAVLHEHFAPQQVGGLDAVRAFMNHVEPVVAPVLLNRKIAGVAITAKDLDRQRVGLQAPFARPALGNRREHLQQQARLVGMCFCASALLIDQTGTVQGQCQRTFPIGFLRQQHALDIGVFDDAHLGRSSILAAAADGAALRPVARVVQRGVVAGQAEHGGGDADTNARLVHHVKHAAQSLARLPYQVANRTGASGKRAVGVRAQRVLALTKIEQAVGGAAPTQLVVQAGQRHIVALTGQLPLGIDHFLGNDEQRNAARAGHQLAIGPRNFGQHQVNDVVGQFVVAGRDPHFVALEPVARPQRVGGKVGAIGQGPGEHIAQRRPGLRL